MIAWSEYTYKQASIINQREYSFIVSFISRENSILISRTIYLSVYCLGMICASNIIYLLLMRYKLCDFLVSMLVVAMCLCVYCSKMKKGKTKKENKDYCWARSWAAWRVAMIYIKFGSLQSARVQPPRHCFIYVFLDTRL